MGDFCNSSSESWYKLEQSDVRDNDTSSADDVVESIPARFVPSIKFSTSDERGEEVHTIDSLSLLLTCFLLGATVITIWIFKARRFRILHETGLSLIYGIIFGAISTYSVKENKPDQYHLLSEECQETTYEGGDDIIIQGSQDDQRYFCAIQGRVYRDSAGNDIQESLLFDPELFFFALLPPIIFYAGYSLHKRHFFRNLGSLATYAFIGTTISCAVVGFTMFLYTKTGLEESVSYNNDETFQKFGARVIPSLLFGALISATDPVTVLAVFHDLHVDFDLYSLVFGESVLNDAVAIVLYRSVDEYDVPPGETNSFHAYSVVISFLKFIGIFVGSFVLGFAIGLITALFLKMSKLRDYPLLETSLFMLMSYSAFLIAEAASLSGIVAILFCGIMQSHYTYINLSVESRRKTKEVFEILNFLAENFVFIYMGLSLFTFNKHRWYPGFILASFVGILIGRILNIYVLSFLLNHGRRKKISFNFQHILVFAGLRGAIAFALAIRNTETEVRQLIFTCTLVIVLVTVLINGGFTTLMLQLLKIKVGVVDDESEHFQEEGQVIPYDRSKGNWLIFKFTQLDKNYLIPFFTHRGRPLGSFLPSQLNWLVALCSKCKPKHQTLHTADSEEESYNSMEDEGDDEEEITMTAYHRQVSDAFEEMGDIGLGNDPIRLETFTAEDQNAEDHSDL